MNYQKNINEVGKVCGAFLSIIPFYYFYRQFCTLGELKNLEVPQKIKSTIKTNTIITTVLLALSIISAGIATIYFISILDDFMEGLLYSVSYAFDKVRYDSFDDVVIAIVFLVICSIVSLAFSICAIITGNSVKNFLDSDESSTLTDPQRYNTAKYVGASFRFIPFYLVIKSITVLPIIKEQLPQFKTLFTCLIVFYALSFISTPISTIYTISPSSNLGLAAIYLIISLVSTIASNVYFILVLVLGIKLSNLFKN